MDRKRRIAAKYAKVLTELDQLSFENMDNKDKKLFTSAYRNISKLFSKTGYIRKDYMSSRIVKNKE